MVVVPMPRSGLSTAAVLEDRRALVQAAREATGRNDPSPAKPHVLAPARPSPIHEQTFRAMAAWAYITPFLFAFPFFLNPPGWIAVLSQLPTRDDATRASPGLPRPSKDVLESR
ncbi:MAG TPA: hypothetical protein VGB82_16435 [Alphaproteobacteria bacterium]